MNSREILELAGYFIGTGVSVGVANKLGKKYANWAKKINSMIIMMKVKIQ